MAHSESPLEYRALPVIFYSDLEGSNFPDPEVVIYNEALGAELGLPSAWEQTDEGAAVLSGAKSLNPGGALAMAYCGHQFGQWAGLLGDGRARLVGEAAANDGTLRELHLKGAGQTPYSRRGDGLATLGSAIREYVVSEAMAALGIPTTRALSIVTTGQAVHRSVAEPGAIICRTAKSHIRVGTFQFAATSGDTENIQALADFAIERLYGDAPKSGPERYGYFLREVSKRQADLTARWMGLGFIHGVMNTDNMCVSGETIDYGPCAFMDDFHPAKVFSSIDRRGRYAWNKQPEMAHWNLARLAESLLPLLGPDEDAQVERAERSINVFADSFKAAFHTVIRNKFGLGGDDIDLGIDIDAFSGEAFKAMGAGEVDFTRFFTALTRLAAGGEDQPVIDVFKDADIGRVWLSKWKELSGFDGGLSGEALAGMRAANPVIIPRNHRVEEAIDAGNRGDFTPFHRLLKAVRGPFTERPEFSEFELPPLDTEIVHQTFCGT